MLFRSLMMCERYATRGNVRGYSYNDEMKGQAILQLVSIGLQFDESKSDNPFAYFTQIAWNAFIRRINKEKKQAYVKHKNFEHFNVFGELSEELNTSGAVQKVRNEYSEELIKNFEEKLVKNSKKKKNAINFIEEVDNNEEPTPDPN